MPQGFALVHNKQILLMRPWGQLHIYAQRDAAELILKDVHNGGLPEATIMEVNISPQGQNSLPSWMT